jgi:hypothetical protein
VFRGKLVRLGELGAGCFETALCLCLITLSAFGASSALSKSLNGSILAASDAMGGKSSGTMKPDQSDGNCKMNETCSSSNPKNPKESKKP